MPKRYIKKNLSASDKHKAKPRSPSADRDLIKRKVEALEAFFRLANIMDGEPETPPRDCLKQPAVTPGALHSARAATLRIPATWPKEHDHFFKEFFKRFRNKMLGYKGGVIEKSIGGYDIGYFYYNYPDKFVPRRELYELFLDTRNIVSKIRKGIPTFSSNMRLLMVGADGVIKRRFTRSPLDLLVWALDGLPADRIRRCPVCSAFYWATRKDKPACSPEHILVERVRRFRKGGDKYKG